MQIFDYIVLLALTAENVILFGYKHFNRFAEGDSSNTPPGDTPLIGAEKDTLNYSEETGDSLI
jgi:hypothetical protein